VACACFLSLAGLLFGSMALALVSSQIDAKRTKAKNTQSDFQDHHQGQICPDLKCRPPLGMHKGHLELKKPALGVSWGPVTWFRPK